MLNRSEKLVGGTLSDKDSRRWVYPHSGANRLSVPKSREMQNLTVRIVQAGCFLYA